MPIIFLGCDLTEGALVGRVRELIPLQTQDSCEAPSDPGCWELGANCLGLWEGSLGSMLKQMALSLNFPRTLITG